MHTYNYIYLITNKTNGKIYIGKHSTNNLDDGYMGSGKIIKLAIKKEGIKNFTKEILSYADTLETLNFLERFYIKKYKARNSDIGYNISEGGDGSKLSEETKEKISKANKGKKRKPFSDDTRLKMSINGKGKHNHEGENNPNWKGGKKPKMYVQREIINKHISEAKKGSIPWNKGKHYNEESKEKMRNAALNRYKKQKQL